MGNQKPDKPRIGAAIFVSPNEIKPGPDYRLNIDGACDWLTFAEMKAGVWIAFMINGLNPGQKYWVGLEQVDRTHPLDARFSTASSIGTIAGGFFDKATPDALSSGRLWLTLAVDDLVVATNCLLLMPEKPNSRSN